MKNATINTDHKAQETMKNALQMANKGNLWRIKSDAAGSWLEGPEGCAVLVRTSMHYDSIQIVTDFPTDHAPLTYECVSVEDASGALCLLIDGLWETRYQQAMALYQGGADVGHANTLTHPARCAIRDSLTDEMDELYNERQAIRRQLRALEDRLIYLNQASRDLNQMAAENGYQI